MEQELPTLPERRSSLPIVVVFVLFNYLLPAKIVVDHCVSFPPYSFGHCIDIVCP